jgi:hypothetical protein
VSSIAVGSTAYDTLTGGFELVDMRNTGDGELTDGMLRTLDALDPKLWRVHLQDVGRAGQKTIDAPDGTPWQADIWHPDSPYAAAAREADRQIGRFVGKLAAQDRLDDTLFASMADGQGWAGWHLPMDEASWRTPLFFRGPGVRAGHVVAYAENIDVAPTIAAALGIDPPNPAPGAGRVLEEVFVDGPSAPPAEVPRRLERLNRQIKDHLLLTAELRLLSVRDPRADNALMKEANALTVGDPPPFLGLDQIDRWRETGSIDALLARNEAALAWLRGQRDRLAARPFPTRDRRGG